MSTTPEARRRGGERLVDAASWAALPLLFAALTGRFTAGCRNFNELATPEVVNSLKFGTARAYLRSPVDYLRLPADLRRAGRFLAGPLARRSASNSQARSRVSPSTVSPDRSEALVSPSVT